jgi:hypothetical protein
MMPIFIAHGALGAYDELIYLGIAIVFTGFMVVSWIRGRNQLPEEETENPVEPAAPDSEPSPDHFKLQ